MRIKTSPVARPGLVLGFLLLFISLTSRGQTFDFPKSEGSRIVSSGQLSTSGFPTTPYTMTVWCNEWGNMTSDATAWSTWRSKFKFKSNNTFVKFYFDDLDSLTRFNTPVSYTYVLSYDIYGYNDLSDTIGSVVYQHDTLAVSYNNFRDNTPYQDLDYKKYSGFYKIKLVLTGLYVNVGGTVSPVSITDSVMQHFKVEGTIETQHYDLSPYTSSVYDQLQTEPGHLTDNLLQVSWNFQHTPYLTPINYELEWTYFDDIKVDLSTGGTIGSINSALLTYNFTNNATRVSVNTNTYKIPLLYSHGYIAYRVRCVRPDSVLFKYPVYSEWTLPNQGTFGDLNTGNSFAIDTPVTSPNWQYTISFAEGGKYKHVMSFYDGLLKNRQSITRFNSRPNQLIATNNIYDYEGRLCIKTLPAPINNYSFFYQHNVSLNSITHLPYRAMDFDTGFNFCPHDPVIPAMDRNSLARIYYSPQNPDTTANLINRFIPDAEGYPMVQTVFEPGFADRVSAQGGAGPKLQIGNGNAIKNEYAAPLQQPLNAMFGPNVGWYNFYTMTMSQDPNQQLSMSIKDYHGKQMASAMIGAGNTVDHALTSIGVPGAIYYKQDLLSSSASEQSVDTIAGTLLTDRDYLNESNGVDTLQYIYGFTPFEACTGKYLSVKGHYNYYITDACGITKFSENGVLGSNGVSTTPIPVSDTGTAHAMGAEAAKYHVHKSLSFNPSDVDAALDSFFVGAPECFLKEPAFIRQSVENAEFPCTGADNADSTPCSRMKTLMIKQLVPGAVYGEYSVATGNVVGTGNSIFSLNCPPDTFHVLRYTPPILHFCFQDSALACQNTILNDPSGIGAGESICGPDTGLCKLSLQDTCVTATSFTTNMKIEFPEFTEWYLDSAFGSLQHGNITGQMSVYTTANALGTLYDNITLGGVIIGSVYSYPGANPTFYHQVINMPVTIEGDSIYSDIVGILPGSGDTIVFKINGHLTHTNLFYPEPYIFDSIVSGYPAGTCGYSPGMHYRYQDTCMVSMPDTITAGGVLYHHLSTMATDSFVMVYNAAISEGNYAIAEALLPLHPQYCELQHCYNDSFKTQVLAIPNWHVAQSLSLFKLEDIIAGDPIKDSMLASGLFPHPSDTLRTYMGGQYTLDTFLFMNAYCSCSDSAMFAQCCSDMFLYQIQHRLLVNDAVKDFYFKHIYDLYFTNRQRIVDKLMNRDGMSCSHCAVARMSPDPAATLPPPPLAMSDTLGIYDTLTAIPPGSGWLSHMADMDTAARHDSAIVLYHINDSLMAYGALDTIMAHLGNCIGDNSTYYTSIRNTLIGYYNAGSAPAGNFTQAQLSAAITGSGIAMNDICNPFIITTTKFSELPPAPLNDCQPSSYFYGIDSFLHQSIVTDAITNIGTTYSGSLDTTGDIFERDIARALGNMRGVKVTAAYDATRKLYTLNIVKSATTGPAGTVNLYLHSQNCSTLTSGFTMTSACINSNPDLISSLGVINAYSFVVSVALSGGGTCSMIGWIDSIPTMTYSDNGLSKCVPCTQLRSLYAQFSDSMQVYGVQGPDHPYYQVMLANFMNTRLYQSFSGVDYETFIQSCALADSTPIPLYAGYATYRFNSVSQMQQFIDTLNSIDPYISFNTAYRDSTTDSNILSVSVDLNQVPKYELWKYRQKLKNYNSTLYRDRLVDSSLLAVKPSGEIGYLYCKSGFHPQDSLIMDTTQVRFHGPVSRALWTGNRFVLQDYYDIIALPGTPAYIISQSIYQLTSYFISHSIPGALFTPCYQSTINSDYFKSEKQHLLQYTYAHQGLPSYQVMDSLQGRFLTSRITSFSGFLPGYAPAASAGMFTNLYLADAGVHSRMFDTLRSILNLATNGTAGYIFPIINDTLTYHIAPKELHAYICADGSYWYRYFTNGDTLYNVYVSFPGYIPRSLRHEYRQVAVIPTPGDSLNRSFSLLLVRTGSADTVIASGRTDFIISKSVELDNVVLGTGSDGIISTATDTFDNCERQTLYSAINEGIVNYNNYLIRVKDSVKGAFKSYLVSGVSEHLLLGTLNDEFNYILYNYDRAGNLTATIPPAGVSLIAPALLDSVDHVRSANTPYLCPSNDYAKINRYNYNSLNQVQRQKTIDGGQTNFFHDAAGRLIFSQNAKQGMEGYYTYNIYDQQNRIVETGEAQMGCNYFDPYYYCCSVVGCNYAYPSISGGLISYLISPHPAFIQFLDRVPADSVQLAIRGYVHRDVVKTVYDTAATDLSVIKGLDGQENLRKRVASVKYFELKDTTDIFDTSYTYATHYSYDIEGNVKTLTHDFPELSAVHQRYKRIDYDYDLISGKVNLLSYNRGLPDQYYQKYTYDADNRITEVHTSKDGYLWETDVRYSYYDHGPLATVTVGNNNVQGMEYAYTIQGWLKAMNCDSLNTNLDMGLDASHGNIIAKDAVAYTMDYFSDDYKPITSNAVQHVTPVSLSLYNGNISRQTVALDTFQRLTKQYMYDQLNRIHSAAYAAIDPVHGTLTGLTDFMSHYDYDADGNLTTLVRYTNNTTTGVHAMDSLIYSYSSAHNNRLDNVYDYATDTTNPNAIRYFSGPPYAPRYRYDRIGNTTGDLVSGQDTVDWNLYNKVVRAVNNSDNSSMEFTYDGAGNRVAKSYYKTTHSGQLQERDDYYVHDAQGNILAVYHANLEYDDTGGLLSQTFGLAEHDVYGSSRLGIKGYYPGQVGISRDPMYGFTDSIRLWQRQPWYSLEYQDVVNADSLNLYGNGDISEQYGTHITGQKQYEITDHLGDVLATVSDKRMTDSLKGSQTTGSVDTIVSYSPVVVSATDYYPFGMPMPGRHAEDTATHCFNATIVEPVNFFVNQYYDFNSVYFSITMLGSTYATSSITDLILNMATDTADGVMMTIDSLTPGVPNTITIVSDGSTGNFLATATGTIPGSIAIPSAGIGTASYDIVFTPSGTTTTLSIRNNPGIPGSSVYHRLTLRGIYLPRYSNTVLENVVTSVCNEDQYHYGFNGQMKVNEIAGVGNHNTALFWEYDTRTGRRWNLDPIPKYGISIYSAFSDNPILYNDILGDDTGRVVISEKIWKNVYKTHLDGIKKNPQLVSPNGKIYLSYDPNRSNAIKRRREARGNNPTMPEQNLDEFPYASTREGGRNAAVNYVPESENKEHGGYIGSVVLRDKMRDGDLFEITLVPDNDQKKKVPQLNPLIVPSFKPRPYMGYPGQGVGDLISKGIEYLTGKRIWIPDPVIAPVPAPIPAPIPAP